MFGSNLIEALTPLTSRWKLLVGLLVLLFVIISVTFDWNIITLIGVIAINGYGVVTISRKLIQLLLARRNIAFHKYVVRQPLINTATTLYPQHAAKIYAISQKNLLFEDFRRQIIDTIKHAGDTEWDTQEAWNKLYLASFSTVPNVGIVVPTYKTKRTELKRLIRYISQQSYPNLHVRIVINQINPELEGFANRLITLYGNENYKVLIQPIKGKRHAMKMGFDALLDPELRCKYIFNIDSDSSPDLDAIGNCVRVFESDVHIKCLTGNIKVENKYDNLLTMLTYQRYFYAFNVERAAQSFYKAVTCMSGPLMAIESNFLRSIKEDWAIQTYFGKECTYGDDRHIATLTLKHGEGSVYIGDAICYTDAPTGLKESIVQQTRWARSSWRETFISLAWFHKMPLWVILDTIYLTAFPFVLIYTFPNLFGYLAVNTTQIATHVAFVGFLTLFFNSLYGMFILKDWRFIFFPLYTLYQTLCLLPSKIYALLTPFEVGWGTK